MGNLQSLCNDSSRYDRQLITEKQPVTAVDERMELSAQAKKDVEGPESIHPVAEPLDPEALEKERAEKSFLEKVSKVAKFIPVEEFKNVISPEISKIRSESPLPETDIESKGVYHLDPLVFVKNNNVYHGSWNEKGEMEGRGQYLLNDGHFIEGVWKEGHIVEGRVFQKDGTYYRGQISNDMANGKGEYVSEDIIYDGDWKNNKKDGYGSLAFRKDSTTYSGQFKDDEMNGQGTIKWPDGYSYIGNFENSMIHGKGKFFAASKATYAGDWVHNVMESKSAVYTWPDTTIKYNGEYKQGKKEGNGTLYQKGEVLSGHWKDNKLHGEGEYQMSNKKYKLLWRFGKVIENSIEPLDEIEPDEEKTFGPSAVYKKLLKVAIPLENDISDYKPSHLRTEGEVEVDSQQHISNEYKPTTKDIQNIFEQDTVHNMPGTDVKPITATTGVGFNMGGGNITMETNANAQTVTAHQGDSSKKPAGVTTG